jgi:hypothetical protein
MCTATWLRESDGYQLFFNRDERLSRPRAVAPRVQDLGGVIALAPTDVVGGGTWIGANDHGVSVCLVNAYPSGEKAGSRSRGTIVHRALRGRDMWRAVDRALELDAREFAPFVLLAIDMKHGPALVSSNGVRFTVRHATEDDLPLTSSSICDAAARTIRRAQFRWSGNVTPQALSRFHRSHDPVKGALSVCMHRDDAATVSSTHIHVTRQDLRMSYIDGLPCSELLCSNTYLSRSRLSPAKIWHPSAPDYSPPIAASL